MTSWDFLNSALGVFPPVAAVLLLVTAGIVFIVGFARYGTNFIKCGFSQTELGASLGKRFDEFEAKQTTRFDEFEAKQTKHFDEFEAKQARRFDEFEAKQTTRFDEFEVRIDNRFNKFETRLDGLETRLDGLETRFDGLETRFNKVETRLDRIEVNHFGHLKKYLGVLNGILLDKKVIDNESKARLDNELEGM